MVRQETLALVLEAEASIEHADDHEERVIALPRELMAIIELGRLVDWHEHVTLDMVSAASECRSFTGSRTNAIVDGHPGLLRGCREDIRSAVTDM